MKRELLNSFILVLITVAMALSACGGSKKKKSKNTDSQGDVQSRAEQFMTKAGLALAEGDNQTALSNYLAASEAYDEGGGTTLERAEAHFLAADVAYQLNEKVMAIEQYDESVKIYLRYGGNSKMKAANALNNMGTIYKELEDRSKASNCWHRALEIYKVAPPEVRNDGNMAKIEQNIRDLQEGF